MPFNITDPNGHPIGIIADRYTIDTASSMILMVGLTQQQLKGYDIDMDKIRSNIAYSLECQTIFGTIKEEKFDQALKDIWHNEFSHFGYFDEDFLIRRLMLDRSVPMENYLNLQGYDFEGYVLLDGKNLKFSQDGSIVLEMINFHREPPMIQSFGVPLHGKILGISEVSTKRIPMAQPWYHTHETKLQIGSGNVTCELQLEGICPLKKDTVIQVYFEKEKIAAIYGDGILYKVS